MSGLVAQQLLPARQLGQNLKRAARAEGVVADSTGVQDEVEARTELWPQLAGSLSPDAADAVADNGMLRDAARDSEADPGGAGGAMV